MQKIVPNLWFDGQAEEAMNFYTSVFKNSKPGKLTYHGEAGPGPAGTVLTAEWEVEGMQFVGINGGPEFKFTPAVSFLVDCKSQEEVDYYWDKLLDGGEPDQCGWLRDKYGLSWQIVPSRLEELLADPDKAKANRVMEAMLQMVKLDVRALEEAANHA